MVSGLRDARGLDTRLRPGSQQLFEKAPRVLAHEGEAELVRVADRAESLKTEIVRRPQPRDAIQHLTDARLVVGRDAAQSQPEAVPAQVAELELVLVPAHLHDPDLRVVPAREVLLLRELEREHLLR